MLRDTHCAAECPKLFALRHALQGDPTSVMDPAFQSIECYSTASRLRE